MDLIYCWSYVKQLCKLKKILTASLFQYLLVTTYKSFLNQLQYLMIIFSCTPNIRITELPWSQLVWIIDALLYFLLKRNQSIEQRKSSILFRTQHLLTLPMHTCIYTHTHTHLYIYIHIHTIILVYFGIKAYHSL